MWFYSDHLINTAGVYRQKPVNLEESMRKAVHDPQQEKWLHSAADAEAIVLMQG